MKRAYASGALRTTILVPTAIVVGIVITPAMARAEGIGALLTLPGFFDQIALFVCIVAIAGAIKVYQIVKGGALAKIWQYLIIGLGCLGLSELCHLGNATGFLATPDFLRPLFLAAMVVVWLKGFREAQKTLG